MTVLTDSQPASINRAWSDFLAHLPTLLAIGISTLIISAAGSLAYFLISLTAIAIVGLEADRDSTSLIAALLGWTGSLPFVFLSALVGVLISAVPALYYSRGDNISIEDAFRTLLRQPWRYICAGALYCSALLLGFALCLLPGVAVNLVGPIYINKIFTTNEEIISCFTNSFRQVFGTERGRNYALIEVLTWMVIFAASICTCGLTSLVAVPVASFYLQQLAYNKDLV